MVPGLYPIFNHWHEKGTLYICADPHFGDEDLRAGTPGRPDDQEIIRRINSKVGRTDHLIILGDIGSIEMAAKLRGHKILVCGNHDLGATNYSEVFEEIYTGPVMIGEKIILSHEPIPNCVFALNAHGHVHRNSLKDPHYLNACLDANDYYPLSVNALAKQGWTSKIESIHRTTIDRATARAKKRGYKLGK